MTDILKEICDAKRRHVHSRRKIIAENELLIHAQRADRPRGFMQALTDTIRRGRYGLIAEIKKASPSKGIIRADFSPASLAEAYERGGATCLSVLTDIPYFQGHDDYLAQARAACTLPCLRKDFMLEPYQIIESRALNADCVLLIMAALSDAQAAELFATATQLGMDVLVEVHDSAEMERALSHLPAHMIGINNRSLHSFETTLKTTETLAKMLPPAMLGVSESGIFTHADVTHIADFGVRAFLVGESLMRAEDVTAATQALLG